MKTMAQKEFNRLSKNTYKLPFDEKLKLKPEPAPKHYKSMVNALDFAMPEGTPIYVAKEGIVIKVKDDSDIGGPDESFRKRGNFIRIKHYNEEYTEYVHLKYKGSLVKEKQHVKKGWLIGYSGITGFRTYPHLHFGVFKLTKKQEKVYIIPRLNVGNKVVILKSPK